MSRPYILKAVKDPSGKWMVNIPSSLSETGKRGRKFLDTKGQAAAFIEELKTRRDNRAVAPSLSASQLLDAAAAFELRDATCTDATLAEAMQSFLATLAQQTVSVPLAILFTQFQASRASKSKYHLRDLRRAHR